MEDEYKSFHLRKKKNTFLLIVSVAVMFFYFVMFTSAMWLPSDGGDYQQIAINQSIINEEHKRTLTLVRWDYSEEQKQMQIQFRIENFNYDGKNEYNFSAIDKNNGKLKTVSVYQDMEILVIDIKDVPKKWSTISLRIGFAEEDPDQKNIFKIYGNSQNINEVNAIEEGNKNSYYILDTECQITEIEKQIEDEKYSITKHQDRISEITKTMSIKTENLEYMTEKEKKEAIAEISSMENEIKASQDSIKGSEDRISEYQDRIAKLEEKIKSYE